MSFIDVATAAAYVNELSKVSKPCKVRNGVCFYSAGENSTHVFYLGVDSEGRLWKHGYWQDMSFDKDGNVGDVMIESSYSLIEKGMVYLGNREPIGTLTLEEAMRRIKKNKVQINETSHEEYEEDRRSNKPSKAERKAKAQARRFRQMEDEG